MPHLAQISRWSAPLAALLLSLLVVGVVWADTVLTDDGFTETADWTELAAHTPDTTGSGWTVWFQTASSDCTDLSVPVDSEGFKCLVVDGANDWAGTQNGEANDIVAYMTDDDPSTVPVDIEVAFPMTETDDGSGQCDPAFLFGQGQGSTYETDIEFYALAIYGDGAVELLYIDTTGASNLLDSTTGNATDDVWKLELRANSQKGYRNSGGGYSEVLSATDSNISATGAVGIGLGDINNDNNCDTDSSWQFDDFLSTEITGEEPAEGDSYIIWWQWLPAIFNWPEYASHLNTLSDLVGAN